MKRIVSGGDRLDQVTAEELGRKFNVKVVQQVYGLTETSACIRNTEGKLKAGTNGSPIPKMQIRVRYLFEKISKLIENYNMI